MTNTYSWGQRWLPALKDRAFDGAVFEPQLRYVVTRPHANVASDAYVVNLNFRDSDGNGYTRPESAVLENGRYKLYGNQRRFDALVEPVITKNTDFDNPTTSVGNRIEGRLRFMFAPHRGLDTATNAFKFFYNASNKPDPVISCVWVTGPDLPGNGGQNAGNTGPVGGILLKVPRSDYVARQDYMAVHVKFSDTFDPHGNAEDRKSLLKACAARERVGSTWEVATWSTNNQFAIDAAKTSGSSTFAWPSAAQGNLPYSWAPLSAGYSANTHGANSYAAMVGSRQGTYAVAPVTAAVKAAYRPTSMPVYTFYAFQQSGIPVLTYGGSVGATPVNSGNDSTPVISADPSAWFNAAAVIKSRMIGAKPYLEVESSGVYSGTAAFGSVSTASTFLATNATTLRPNAGPLTLTWSVPEGATATDRIGYSCWANWTNTAGSEVRWGPSVSNNSWPVPRNIRTRSFTLEEDCVGYEWVTAANQPTITSRYREIWARTYDAENRQIQSVQYARR